MVPLGYTYHRRRCRMCEREGIEFAGALLENTSVTYLELDTENDTKSSAEAVAKYVHTTKRLHRIHWPRYARTHEQREEMLCCFLPAFQESSRNYTWNCLSRANESS
jgi:hypothetical protein